MEGLSDGEKEDRSSKDETSEVRTEWVKNQDKEKLKKIQADNHSLELKILEESKAIIDDQVTDRIKSLPQGEIAHAGPPPSFPPNYQQPLIPPINEPPANYNAPSNFFGYYNHHHDFRQYPQNYPQQYLPPTYNATNFNHQQHQSFSEYYNPPPQQYHTYLPSSIQEENTLHTLQ